MTLVQDVRIELPPRLLLACCVGLACVALACGGTKNTTTSPSTSAVNRPPVVGSLNVTPTGMGIQSATNFTFNGQGISDPDGDTLTFSWTSSDGQPIPSTASTASRVFTATGTFEIRLTATDPKGLTASATASVSVATVSGVWDVTCDNRSAEARRLWPNFPSVFVVSLSQNTQSLSGSMSGGGLARNFTVPGTASDPRQITFGVETTDNVWASRDGDFYFRLALTDTLRSGTSVINSFYCGSSVATKR